MDVDAMKQPPPPPSHVSPPPSFMSTGQQGQFADDTTNYYSQSQSDSNDSVGRAPQPAHYAPPAQEVPAQPAYQKHQPLIDQSATLPPEYDLSPDVRFSANNDYSAQDTDPYSSLSRTTRKMNMRYQIFLDKISPHWKARWAFSLIALMVFMARVIIAQGWYVICYALAIYYLNLLIGFISPKVDPGMGLNDDNELGEAMLPTHANDEFRPFIRRVPEFKFWISGTKATLLSLFLSMFDIFDVPVFWPILLIYFIILFACTMRQQIQHMIRYSYVPWDSGKKKYTDGASKEPASDFSPQTV